MSSPELSAKIQMNIELAADVQRSMLPLSVPTVPGYSFWVHWQPELSVGGDIYDFQVLKTGEILVLAGDVAGKGLAAALSMVSLAAIIPIVLEQTGNNLTEFVSALNKSVHRWLSRVDRFVTLI